MVSGVIQRVNDKQWKDKTFYSFALSGQDGWFNTGVKRPPAIGTSVKFNYKTNDAGYKNVDGSIEIVADQAVGPVSGISGAVSASAGQSGKSGGGGSQAYWDRKEARDITNDAARELGASRNTAIAIIDLALKHEVIKLPAQSKREEFIWTLLDKYTNKLMGKDDGSGITSSSNDSGTGSKNTGGSGTAEEATTNDPENDNWS